MPQPPLQPRRLQGTQLRAPRTAQTTRTSPGVWRSLRPGVCRLRTTPMAQHQMQQMPTHQTPQARPTPQHQVLQPTTAATSTGTTAGATGTNSTATVATTTTTVVSTTSP